ncbi:MAG: hypothetical protein KGP29_05105 [Proteobacteria bacterium]|nr:hypothetical protein [Pseudomonadota bacterium]
MKKILLALSLTFITACAIGAGENSKMIAAKNGFFPQLTGIDLEGEKRELPQSFDKKLNIVVVAFKREQQENVNGWIKATEEVLAKKPEIGFYELPLIYEMDAISRKFINNGMRRGVPGAKARKHTITVYTDREKFFELMKMKEEKIYLLALNQEGKILLRIEGDATKKNTAALMKFLKRKS